MVKFIFLFLYLSFCVITDIASMAPSAPTPQQKFSIFKSLNINHEKQLVYREIIPIIATGDKKESLDFRSLILENKITGAVAFQIQIFRHTNTNMKINNNTNTLVFDSLSIAFTSKGENHTNTKFLPIIKPSLSSLNKENLSTSYIGSIYLFPDDVTNLITSITKDPLTIVQIPFLSFDFM